MNGVVTIGSQRAKLQKIQWKCHLSLKYTPKIAGIKDPNQDIDESYQKLMAKMNTKVRSVRLKNTGK